MHCRVSFSPYFYHAPYTASNFVWSAPIPNPNQANSALTFYVHFGPVVDQQLRVVSSLLTQILTEPAFIVLRTQEQLGYIVSCSPWLLPGGSEKGLRIVVQSEKNPGYLEERVEAFLDRMKNVIDNMSNEVFAEQKNGLEKKWLEVDKNLADEHSRFAAQINSGHWDFLRRTSLFFIFWFPLM
jgi:insulysin